jgi:hypothetical protein
MYSSYAVGPIFADITAQVLKTFRVPPSTDSAAEFPLTW